MFLGMLEKWTKPKLCTRLSSICLFPKQPIQIRINAKGFLINSGNHNNIYILSANIIGITVDWLQSSHLFVFLALSEHFKTSLQMSSIRLPLRTGDVNLYLSLPSVTTSGVTSDRLPTKSFSLCDTHYIRKVIIKLLLEYYHNRIRIGLIKQIQKYLMLTP